MIPINQIMKPCHNVLTALTVLLLLAFQVAPAHARIFEYSASLSGPNESPPNASPATGFADVHYDNVLHQLTVDVTFTGLLGTTTASHIHSATTVPGTGTAGVATTTPTFAGFPIGVTSGTYHNVLDLTLASSYNPAFITANGGTTASAEAALAAGLAAGEAYLNIHTSIFGGGEIRGFLMLTSIATGAFQIRSIAKQGNDVLINWQTTGGSTNLLQVTKAGASGTYSNDFVNLSPMLFVTGIGDTTTNYLDVGGATNSSSRFYRVKMVSTITTQAADNAADPAYSGGWTNGSNGGTGFNPWTLTATSPSVDTNGFFTGSSTNNAGVTQPGIDASTPAAVTTRRPTGRLPAARCKSGSHCC